MKNYFRVPNEIFNKPLTTTEKMVLIYIYRCTNNKVFSPSYTTIADKCSITRRSAIRIINSLIEKGEIIKDKKHREFNTYMVSSCHHPSDK